jgi:hypothetical protein
MWQKYKIGESLKINDPDGEHQWSRGLAFRKVVERFEQRHRGRHVQLFAAVTALTKPMQVRRQRNALLDQQNEIASDAPCAI